MTPTQLSLRKLRADGYLCVVVEHWNAFARKRQDLFGFDIIAVTDDGVLLVQTTSAANVSARIHKIEDLPSTARLRKAGARMVVHGWRKVGNRWQVREVDIS